MTAGWLDCLFSLLRQPERKANVMEVPVVNPFAGAREELAGGRMAAAEFEQAVARVLRDDVVDPWCRACGRPVTDYSCQLCEWHAP